MFYKNFANVYTVTFKILLPGSGWMILYVTCGKSGSFDGFSNMVLNSSSNSFYKRNLN